MENQINKNKGFSLIELLIAVTLLSIIMLMVSQFMGTTSWALTKAKKNQNIQTEAMEVGSQFSDTLMQATYIRVRTQDNKIYELNTNMNGNKELRDAAIGVKSTLGAQYDFVVDNYPNYLQDGVTNRDIILQKDDFTLVKPDGTTTYPIAGDEDLTAVMSFRKLTSNRTANPTAKSLYVKPMYIYVHYKKKVSGTETDAYVIYYFKDNKIYMDRGELSSLSPDADGFCVDSNPATSTAIEKVTENANAGVGLVTENLSDCYFSADTEANTVFLDMLFENEKFKGYTYNYVEAIVLRNSNVLTVPPQQMYRTK